MLLPRLPELPENIDPAALQHFLEQAPPPNAWNTPLTSVNPIVHNPAVTSVRSARNTPASYVKIPASSKTLRDFAPSPAAPPRTPLFPGNHLPPPLQTPNVAFSTSPFYPSNKIHTPLLGWQSPLDSSFSHESSKHTNSLISPSHLRSYMAEHNIENHEFQSTSTAAPIDDQVLFSSVTIWVLAASFTNASLDAQSDSRKPREAHGAQSHNTSPSSFSAQ
ncbi:hypothetical protein B0H19DRAFT_417318 [Mycena capillaripes]|nr:hypothetical protein B0H19DRAFT_417318 [Mycena capillaripes]